MFFFYFADFLKFTWIFYHVIRGTAGLPLYQKVNETVHRGPRGGADADLHTQHTQSHGPLVQGQ